MFLSVNSVKWINVYWGMVSKHTIINVLAWLKPSSGSHMLVKYPTVDWEIFSMKKTLVITFNDKN